MTSNGFGYTPPVNHDYGSLSDVDSKAGKGKSLKVPGILYCWSQVISQIYGDKTEWVDVKIGIAHGSEAQAVIRAEGAATDNGSDIIYHWILPVADCQAAEVYIGDLLKSKGFSTKHGDDAALPKRYKKFYVRQTGGKEWYVLPMRALIKAYEMTKDYMDRDFGTPTRLEPFHGTGKRAKFEWIGESNENAPTKFEINSYGDPVAKMSDRKGGVIKNKKLEFAFMMRRMTGIAPKGCKSQDARYRHEFI